MLMDNTMPMQIEGREIVFFNQRSEKWTHPYPYEGHGNLKNSGCGIFALCHCAQWLTGEVPSAEDLADFSVRWGGRGDDGTDRPALLHALMVHNRAAELGFRYEEDGLLNDKDKLFDFLISERGVCMGNIRVGHIVTFVAAREKDGDRQLLVIDSHSESMDPRVLHGVRKSLPQTMLTWREEAGLRQSCAAFWVDSALARDYNLLHRID